MKFLSKKMLGGLLVVLSGVLTIILYLLGVPLFSAEGRNLSTSPNSIAWSGHVAFHWPVALLPTVAVVGVVLLLSSSRGASRA